MSSRDLDDWDSGQCARGAKGLEVYKDVKSRYPISISAIVTIDLKHIHPLHPISHFQFPDQNLAKQITNLIVS
jgi:hypothetical protein